MKAWDISGVDFDDQTTSSKFNELYFIIGHRSTINSIVIVENSNIKTGKFIVTAGNDCNILLHKLETGVRIGKFFSTRAGASMICQSTRMLNLAMSVNGI